METLGPKIRKQRRRLGLSLDELSGRTGISKPYLSLIETGRVCNPPSDQKLTRLEQTLAFKSGELLIFAHLHRTPSDVRAVLSHLLSRRTGGGDGLVTVPNKSTASDAVCLDTAVLCGALAELLDRAGDNVEPIAASAVPLIDRASVDDRRTCGDANFPPRVAGQFVGCPDIADTAAFAARVQGDCMMPKYRPGDIVIFSPALPPRNGDDCFIRLGDGQTAFKRIFFENDGVNGAASLRLVPRNERHRPTLVAREKIHGLYRAVYRYQRVDED
jgi:repressor LexA